jgi:type IV pilus assembly protein PilC
MNLNIELDGLFYRMSIKDKVLFARHMEMMTRSGMQILDALEVLKRQTHSAGLIRVLDSLIADVRNGHFLSVGMERFKNVFGDFIINLVRVGEASGTLSENFGYLSLELAKKHELQKKVQSAMTYPVILLFMSLGITAMMSFFIFPKILPVFQTLDAELPAMTKVFLAVSTFMFTYGVWVFLGLFLVVVAFAIAVRFAAIRMAWHELLIRLPVIGQMSVQVNIINIARTLNLLLVGGLKIVEALDITADSLPNLVFRKRMHEIAEAVRRGETMSKNMVALPDLFPASFSQMTMVGENTGKLGETLTFLANFYEGELDNTTKTLSAVIEPLMLILMGSLVAFVALSIITPVWKITQTLNR